MAFCTKCGTPLPEVAKFCTQCGAPLNRVKPRPEPDAEAQAPDRPPVRHEPPRNPARAQHGPDAAAQTTAPKQTPWKIIIPVIAVVIAAVIVLVVAVIPANSGVDQSLKDNPSSIDNQSLIGKWKIVSASADSNTVLGTVITFYGNGEVYFDDEAPDEWSTKGNRLTISIYLDNTTANYIYTIDGNTMTWVDIDHHNATTTLERL